MSLAKRLGAEFFGTFWLVLGGCGSAVLAAGVPDLGIGFAVKVDDGAQRAQFPAVLRVLQYFDVLPAQLPQRLEEFMHRPLRNTRGEVVGEVRLAS